MELVRRMKTATSPFRPAIVLGLIAAFTITAGLSTASSAEDSARTLATGSKIPLSAEAPDQYTVKTGDTLWDIAKVFLRDPWYWPEIWYLNPQVQNPHLIYPGDVLKLVSVDGQTRLTIAERGEGGEAAAAAQGGGGKKLSPQVRREPLSQAISAIPYDIIASFAGRPTLLDKDQVKSAPYIVAFRDEHTLAATGNELYARGLSSAPADARYTIIHIEEPLRDPDNNNLLGYEGVYVGSGPVATTGDPAKVLLTDSAREALQGDKLFPESTDVNVDFVPHAPTANVDATIIAVQSHTVIGQYQIVALNRGSSSGLEAGQVLGVNQHGDAVRDKFSKGGLGASSNFGGGKKVQLPDERIGMAMVFKTFPHMSFALIMEASHEIRQGDHATNP
jgi:LysM repeat protein